MKSPIAINELIIIESFTCYEFIDNIDDFHKLYANLTIKF